MFHIFVDADACPVKDEVYRVAARYDLNVTLVAGSWMRTPENPKVALEVVDVPDDDVAHPLSDLAQVVLEHRGDDEPVVAQAAVARDSGAEVPGTDQG